MLRVKTGSTLLDLLTNNIYTPNAIYRAMKIRQADLGRYRRVHLIRGGFDPVNPGGSLPAEALEASPDWTGDAVAEQPGGAAWTQAEGDAASESAGPADAAEDNAASAVGGEMLLSLSTSAVARGRAPGLAEYSGLTAWVEDAARRNPGALQVVDPLLTLREAHPGAVSVQLQPGDVIYLPAPRRTVRIEGLSRPGTYELLSERSLADVLRMAGSVELRYDICNAVVERRDPCCEFQQMYVDLTPGKDDVSNLADLEILDGDTIRLYPRETRIFVHGEVNLPGVFAYNYEDTVSDYITLAQGMTSEANEGWIAIIRQNRDRRYPHEPADVIQVNFKEIHKGHVLPDDYTLKPGDTIYVPPKGERFTLDTVIRAIGTGISTFAVIDQLSGNGNNN
jgi:protein involved in polysaccharide export with SLBB domain